MTDSLICVAGFASVSSIPVTIMMDSNEIWFSMVWERGLLAH